MMRILKYLLITLGAVLVIATVCWLVNLASSDADATYEFRGRYKPSTDGKTCLVIEHDNGGGCGSLSVDGNRWPHRLHEAGDVMPGTRTIQCGGEIDIEIKPGNIYYFNYWGP